MGAFGALDPSSNLGRAIMFNVKINMKDIENLNKFRRL